MKVKALVLSAVMAVSACLGVANNAFAVTCPTGTVHGGEDVASYAECNLPEGIDQETPLMDRVVQIINIVVGVVGIVCVAVIVIGAIYFVVSLGDAAKINRAKNAVLYGVVGLVLSVLAFAVVNFVLTTVFGDGGTGSNTGTSSTDRPAGANEGFTGDTVDVKKKP